MNNLPNIKKGDKVKVTWNERYYGNQEVGTALNKKEVDFGGQIVTVDALRFNENIERIEVNG